MPEVVRCRFDHAGADVPFSVELSEPQDQLVAWSLSDVPEVLAEVEQAVHTGRYAGGFVAYEAAPAFDPALRVPGVAPSADAVSLPLAWFGLFDRSRPAAPLPPAQPGDHAGELPPWSIDSRQEDHASAVGSIRSSIAAGDAYLVNLTTRFRRPWGPTDDPLGLYAQLVAGYAGGFHGYLETPDWVVACGSPELFFETGSGRLTTRPMKGTARRGRWKEEDETRAEQLRTSPKERAENVMVVDLLRNDIGRIAVPGTVGVPALWSLERYPTLWQLTSTVTSALRPDVGLADIFGALFPCGSVTGAPKVSAMSIIADLEPSARGVYCGAVGLVEPCPHSDSASSGVAARFAVAIRTAVVDKAAATVQYGSGGGITWDSAPAEEWDEVLAKTVALPAASGAPVTPGRAGGGLLETMRFDPHRAGTADAGIRDLRRHVARLAASADFVGIPAPVGATAAIVHAVDGVTRPSRVRVVLDTDGALEVEVTNLNVGERRFGVQLLCVVHDPVRSEDAGLFHKGVDRRRYVERARRHLGADDVVLVNERGEVTETTRANLAVRIDGRWWTPPLDSGLLPGVERARLLDAGRLAERMLTVEDLVCAEAVATLSSLRGWRPARLRTGCRGACSPGPPP